MLKLYLSCIRPELEYTATVWSPHQKGQIDTLEHNAPIKIRELHRYSRSNSPTLKVPCVKTNAFYCSFFCDTLHHWKALPQDIADSSDAKHFKSKLSVHFRNMH